MSSYYKANAIYQKPQLPLSNLVTETTMYGDITKKDCINTTWRMSANEDPDKPNVFGPPMWFTFHNGARKYPIRASPICAQRMKGYIIGIPVTIPCETCSDEATAYIESRRDQLDNIVSGRDPLFRFFVDFHNHVNKRLGKPEMAYVDAYNMYNSKSVTVNQMTYAKC